MLALVVVSAVRSPIYALIAHCRVRMITSIAMVKADGEMCERHIMILISRRCHTVVYLPVVRRCCMSWKYNLRKAVMGSVMQSRIQEHEVEVSHFFRSLDLMADHACML